MPTKQKGVAKFLTRSWAALHYRCGGNGKYYTDRSRNRSYAHVFILFTREEYKAWCFRQKDHIESLKRPSLDRIDPAKNYTLDNIQVIELAENIRKDQLKAKDGLCECYRCLQTLVLEAFVKDPQRVNGRKTICRKCFYEYQKERRQIRAQQRNSAE